MKEALAFIGIVAIATTIWFAKGYSDSQLIASNDTTIHSLNDVIQTKDAVIAKQNSLVDAGTTTIKTLQADLQAKDDLLAKDQVVLKAKDESISSLNETIAAKELALKQDADLIASYQSQLIKPPLVVFPFSQPLNPKADKTVDQNQYVKDSGFEAEDLGSGFTAYQIFGKIRTTRPAELPAQMPNRTPWTFGSENSGIVANGSSYYVTGASNHDSDGTTSTNGQAGLIEYEGSSISQVVDLPAGTYSVSFDFEGRRDYLPANGIAVSLGKKLLFTGAPTNCNCFTNVVTRSVTFTKSGKHELEFLGTGNNTTSAPYPATFIDNVRITPATDGADQSTAKNSAHVAPHTQISENL